MTSSRPAVRPIGLTQVADYQPGDTFGPRTLVDYEFVWLLAGSATWAMVDDERSSQHRLAPGSLLLARAGAVDSYQWDTGRPSRHAYLHFGIDDVGDLPEETAWPEVRHFAGNPLIEGICGYLLELAGQPSARARDRSDDLVALLLDVFVSAAPSDPSTALTPQLAAVVAEVGARWASDGLCIVGVDELATAVSLSVGHLHRLFRQGFGCGPAHALEIVRLARAATSLQRSNATIAEVARLSGFANPYHFSRRFTTVYGTPPGAYRRLTPRPDPLGPARDAGLLPIAHALLNYAPG